MKWVVLVAAAALAAVASAGVLWPFTRGRRISNERTPDPLEDERAMLLRSLRELEQERSDGTIEEVEYRSLRRDTEVRAVAVLRALSATRGAGSLAEDVRELRTTAVGNGRPGGERRGSRAWPALVVGLVFVAAVVPILAGAVRSRSGDDPATGGAQLVDPTGPGSLPFFEERVEQHPNDPAAHLDLAQRYRDTGDLRRATAQYLIALELDPEDPEARANLGYLLHLGGRSQEGLEAVDRALAEEPGYPEALYFRGVILLEGLERPEDAAEAFRAYLDSAPFGGRRDEVQDLLEAAETAS